MVTSFEGRPIYLKDLARVVDGLEEETSRSRLNGREAVNISVKKRVGENIIAITDQIDDLINRTPGPMAQGHAITKLMDQAKEIRDMVADLENNIISGLILVIVVLFFALGFRNAILVGLAIPFSMLLSFMVLYGHGYHPEHGGAVFPDPGPGHAGGQRHRDRGKYLPLHGTGGAAHRGGHEGHQ